MRDYELVVVVKPDVTEEGVSQIVNKVTGFVTEKGGNVVKVDQWGRRKLAYPIKQYLEGNYFLAHLKLEASQVKELEANLRLSEEIIRHLIIRTKNKKES